MLEDLLNAGEAEARVHLAESSWKVADDLSALRAEYDLRYARAVDAVCESRGEPAFTGGPGDRGFPAELGCECVSMWHGPRGTIYLGLESTAQGLLLVGGARARRLAGDHATLPPPAQ
jgi:hypothetical protein